MYRICSNIKCNECTDITAQSGTHCFECNRELVECTTWIETNLKKLQDTKFAIQNYLTTTLNEQIAREAYNEVKEIAQEDIEMDGEVLIKIEEQRLQQYKDSKIK